MSILDGVIYIGETPIIGVWMVFILVMSLVGVCACIWIVNQTVKSKAVRIVLSIVIALLMIPMALATNYRTMMDIAQKQEDLEHTMPKDQILEAIGRRELKPGENIAIVDSQGYILEQWFVQEDDK